MIARQTVAWKVWLLALAVVVPAFAAAGQDESATQPSDADVALPASRPMAGLAADLPDTVLDIRIEGNRELSAKAVMAYVRLRAGQVYDEKIVQADQERMLRSGHFESVSALHQQTPQGVIVTFVVVDRQVIAAIEFKGNTSLKAADILKELPISVGGPLNRLTLNTTSLAALVRKYHEEGFPFVEVKLDESTLPDRKVVYQIVEGPKVRIRKIRFTGNEYFSDLKLRLEIRTWARLWPFVSGFIDDDKIVSDENAIRQLYVDEGFLDAEVTSSKTFSDNKADVTLTFRIVEGPRYRVNRTMFEGNAVYNQQEILRRFQLDQGRFLTTAKMRHDRQALVNMYGQIGYIEVNVEQRKVFVDLDSPVPEWAREKDNASAQPRPALVNMVYTIRESEQFTVGQIDIRGNRITQDRVIRRDLRLYPTQLFDMVAVEESRRQLTESLLFEKVSITPTGNTPGVRDAVVEVTEGRTAQFIIGVGISSNNGLLGNISLTERNFDATAWPSDDHRISRGEAFRGAGQTLRIAAEPGTELMRFYIDWTEPYLGDKPVRLNDRLYYSTRERETYDEVRYGDVASLGYLFKNRWYAEGAQRVEGVTIDDLDRSDAPPEVFRDQGDHLILSSKGTLVRDRTDSRWTPTTGDRLSFSYEQVYGEYVFGVAEGEYRAYRTVHTDALDRKHVLAGRMSASQIVGGGAPVFETLYGGGTGSVRGFAYRGISPRSKGTDEPIGGDFMLLAGVEYNYPLIGEFLRGTFFVDSGTVEPELGLESYRVSTGFGVRLVIPFMGPMPMSFDFGFPLVYKEEDDRQVFSFSMGWTF